MIPKDLKRHLPLPQWGRFRPALLATLLFWLVVLLALLLAGCLGPCRPAIDPIPPKQQINAPLRHLPVGEIGVNCLWRY